MFDRWRRFEDRHAIEDSPLHPADVLVAVGCANAADGVNPSSHSWAIAQEVRWLFDRRFGPDVLFQGAGWRKNGDATSEAVAMARAAHMPAGHYLLEEKSHNTRQNAEAFAIEAKQHGWKKAILVAQKTHARRVLLTYQKVCPDIEFMIVGVRSNYGGCAKWFLNHFWTFFLWEKVMLAYFRLRHWI